VGLFIVYCHTNENNGKAYIGYTALRDSETLSDAMTRRWYEHRAGSRSASRRLFYQAIRKYGDEVWRHELIEIVTSKFVVKKAEQFWIADRKTNAFRGVGYRGYNMTDGGESSWMLGRRHTPETLRKISQAGLGRKRSLEACQRNGNSHRGKPKPTLRKAVLQFSLNGELLAEFPSIRDASSATGVNQNSICRCCKGTVKRPRQFMWSYKDCAK